MHNILLDIWHGLWTGFGVELSFLILYIGWRITHSRIAHKVGEEHWIHKIGEYIDK